MIKGKINVISVILFHVRRRKFVKHNRRLAFAHRGMPGCVVLFDKTFPFQHREEADFVEHLTEDITMDSPTCGRGWFAVS